MHHRCISALTRKLAFVVTAIALLMGFMSHAYAAEKALVIAFIPQENPEKLVGDIRAATDYLAAELGRPVKGHVTLDHAAAVEALGSGEADIAFMGALPYAMAHARNGAQVVLSEIYRGKPSYSSAIFVRRDAGVRSLADLKGKTIAFADPISESGYLYPLELFVAANLIKRGEDPQAFFGRVYFAGGYQQAIQAVANGLVDAAGVSIYATLLLPPDRQSEITTLAVSPEIPSHAVIARKGLDPDVREAFVAAMLKLNEPDKRHLLAHLYSPDGYALPRQADYDAVADLARKHGLIR